MSIGIVETKLGKLVGVEQTGKYAGNTVFSGVPYAEPPVGELRWKPTVKAKPWEGVLKCDKHAPAAWQVFNSGNMEPYTKDFYFMGNPPVSEDCLYLEITTGASSAGEKRPVFVWFHGGGLNSGYSYEIEFDGNELASKGIVVVSVAQRLNLFGYMALPQLSEEQNGKSGNYGFYDQLTAMDWIYENIEAFGGDPENISVGGQSGGSLKVCMLAGTKADSHIKRCVPQSGLKYLQKFLLLEEAEQKGLSYLEACGIDPSSTIDELRALPPEKFQASKAGGFFRMPGEMVYDGFLVPYLTMRECLNANARNIDFICGTNLGEADPFGSMAFGERKTISNREEFYAHFKSELGDLYDKYDFENLVKVDDRNAWRTARTLASYGMCKPAMVNFSRNLMVNRCFGMNMKKLNPSSNVYAFLFTHLLPVHPEEYGTPRDPEVQLAYHSSEMFYTFASLRDDVPPARPWQPIDFELADTISSYYANFFKNGDPNGDGLPVWPQAGDNFGWMELGDHPTAFSGTDSQLDKLILEYIKREYDIEV